MISTWQEIIISNRTLTKRTLFADIYVGTVRKTVLHWFRTKIATCKCFYAITKKEVSTEEICIEANETQDTKLLLSIFSYFNLYELSGLKGIKTQVVIGINSTTCSMLLLLHKQIGIICIDKLGIVICLCPIFCYFFGYFV